MFSNKTVRPYSTSISDINNISTNDNTFNTSPWFVTGFTDAEGSFITKISKSDKYRTGWKVEPLFSIGLHVKDKSILEAIQIYLGGIGVIMKLREDSVLFAVSSKKDLQVVL